jgi:hypothetical protein
VNQGHLQYIRRVATGSSVEDLANFDARILEEITRHDGIQITKRYKIRATHALGYSREIVIDADEYGALTWIYNVGPGFAIGTGRDTKDKVRHAIQLFSEREGIERRVEHTSLGWIEHEGQWLYLDAAGAIGAGGATDSVQVEIPLALNSYRLPRTPIEQLNIRQAVEAVLSVWDLAKEDRPGGQAAAAILATLPFRSVLSPFNATVHLGGPSGNLKTSIARIAYQHFSTVVIGRNFPMPAGWVDTTNALQRLLFDCGNCLLIIDDLKHQGKTAEVIFQSQGNLQNRARMNTDQSLQKALNPRGSLLSTGEIDPRTSSAVGRAILVEIRTGDIDLGILTRLQDFGDRGLFAMAMVAFIHWLAPQLDAIREEHKRLTALILKEIGTLPGAHARHPDMVAQLVAAYQLFLRFAVERDAISLIRADGYRATAKKILIDLGRAQSEIQKENKPGRRFLEIIASALQTQAYHLLNAQSYDTRPTDYPGACGWRKEPLRQDAHGQEYEWRVPSNSKCIGFIDEKKILIYLIPDASKTLATEMAKRRDDLQSFESIGRELLGEGLCLPDVKDGKMHSSKLIRLPGHGQRRYLCIPIPYLFGESEC